MFRPATPPTVMSTPIDRAPYSPHLHIGGWFEYVAITESQHPPRGRLHERGEAPQHAFGCPPVERAPSPAVEVHLVAVGQVDLEHLAELLVHAPAVHLEVDLVVAEHA